MKKFTLALFLGLLMPAFIAHAEQKKGPQILDFTFDGYKSPSLKRLAFVVGDPSAAYISRHSFVSRGFDQRLNVYIPGVWNLMNAKRKENSSFTPVKALVQFEGRRPVEWQIQEAPGGPYLNMAGNPEPIKLSKGNSSAKRFYTASPWMDATDASYPARWSTIRNNSPVKITLFVRVGKAIARATTPIVTHLIRINAKS